MTTQTVNVAAFPVTPYESDEALSFVRCLDNWAIHLNQQTGRFLLRNETTLVHFAFDTLPQATAAALKHHQAAVDEKNRQALGLPPAGPNAQDMVLQVPSPALRSRCRSRSLVVDRYRTKPSPQMANFMPAQ